MEVLLRRNAIVERSVGMSLLKVFWVKHLHYPKDDRRSRTFSFTVSVKAHFSIDSFHK
jgi:hypothetical protein